MLVLLIMFIITIPVQTHAVKIDLPIPTDSQSNVDPEKNKVMIDPAGTITWNGTPVDLAQLAQYLEKTKAMPVEPELQDRKSTRLHSSHYCASRMPSSARTPKTYTN